MPSILTRKLPQITPKTHIVGICGVGEHQWAEEDGAYASAPHLDGWMVSDFYLLHHLFRGNGKSQAWFTCIDPDILINRHGEFAHGNCYRERRVVLDANQKPDVSTLKIVEPENLLSQIILYLRSQCAVAAAAKEPVLLCIFSHSEGSSFDLEIGGTGDDEHMEAPLLTDSVVSSILKQHPSLNICLLTTSCFFGGWTITPDLHDAQERSVATVITATGEDIRPNSWPKTESLGRACGSIYIASIVKALESSSTDSEVSDGGKVLDSKAFSDLVKHHLINAVDPIWGDIYEYAFEAQAEQWTDHYPATTGLTLRSYSERLNLLRVIPPTTLAAVNIRRETSTTSEECEAFEERNKATVIGALASSNYGGSMMAIKQRLRTEATRYMPSKPGRDSLAGNIAPHGLIRKCIDTPHQVSDQGWDSLFTILHYRRQSIITAETILNVMGIIAPPADTFDIGEWNAAHPELKARSLECYRLVLQYDLIPPYPNAAKRYIKSVHYLGAACAMSGLSKAEVENRIEIARRGRVFPDKILRSA